MRNKWVYRRATRPWPSRNGCPHASRWCDAATANKRAGERLMQGYYRAAKLIQSAAFLVFSIVHEDNDKLVSALFEKGLAPEGFQIRASSSGGRRQEVYRRDTKAVPDEAMTSEFRKKQEGFQAPPGYRFMSKARGIKEIITESSKKGCRDA